VASLEELHKVHTTPRIGKDLKAEEHEIEILTADIKRVRCYFLQPILKFQVTY